MWLIAIIIGAASSGGDGEETASNDDTEIKAEETGIETEIEEEVVTEEPVEEETAHLTEPEGRMEDWVNYTPEEKAAKVKESLEYVVKAQEENGTPLIIIGTTEEFVQIIDERYEEIQGLTGENGR